MYQRHDIVDSEDKWNASDLSDLILACRQFHHAEIGNPFSFWKTSTR